MPLLVRPARSSDVSVLETLEMETVKRFPSRKAWVTTYRKLLEQCLEEEPEGVLVADYDGRAVAAVAARTRGKHPLTGALFGKIELLSVSPTWRGQGIAEELFGQAESYLRNNGCQVVSCTLSVDSGADADLYKTLGFKVSAWELERSL